MLPLLAHRLLRCGLAMSAPLRLPDARRLACGITHPATLLRRLRSASTGVRALFCSRLPRTASLPATATTTAPALPPPLPTAPSHRQSHAPALAPHATAFLRSTPRHLSAHRSWTRTAPGKFLVLHRHHYCDAISAVLSLLCLPHHHYRFLLTPTITTSPLHYTLRNARRHDAGARALFCASYCVTHCLSFAPFARTVA